MLMVREGRPEDTPGLAGLRVAWAAEQDPSLTDDPESQSFYARLGFEPAGDLNILKF